MGGTASKLLLLQCTSTINVYSAPADHPLAEVIEQIEVMRDNVRNLHNTDAEEYDKVACHCEDQTKMLYDNEGGGFIAVKSQAVTSGASNAASAKALMEEAQVELEKDTKELNSRADTEDKNKAAWDAEKSQLNADIDEATLAQNALNRAAEILGLSKNGKKANEMAVAGEEEHNYNKEEASSKNVLDEMLTDMQSDVTATLTALQLRKSEGVHSRSVANGHWIKNKDRLDNEIFLDKESIAFERARKDKNSEKVLENEKQLKQYSNQLHELTDFCERQALDWDKSAAARVEDESVLSMAVNILTCGQKECGASAGSVAGSALNFLQESKSLKLHSTDAQKRNAIRRLVQIGKQTDNKQLMLLQKSLEAVSAKGPLDGAISLLHEIIQKLIIEQKKDTEAMGPCAASLAECTVERDSALGEIEKLKLQLEQISRAQKDDTNGHQEASNEKHFQTMVHNNTQLIQIPEADTVYNSMKDNLQEQRDRLFEAVKVLRNHFGITERDAARDPAQADSASAVVSDNNPATATKETVGRDVNNQGDSQSSGVMLVKLLSQKLAERDTDLTSLREDYLKNRQDLQNEARDAAVLAAENQEKARILHSDMMSDKVSFGETLAELQGKVDQAAAAGRCVQNLEPCGVQVDRRAARAQTIKDLKSAYKILADTEEDWSPSLHDSMFQ